MKKRELILDFTSLLDVIMILLFVVIGAALDAAKAIAAYAVCPDAAPAEIYSAVLPAGEREQGRGLYRFKPIQHIAGGNFCSGDLGVGFKAKNQIFTVRHDRRKLCFASRLSQILIFIRGIGCRCFEVAVRSLQKIPISFVGCFFCA